MVQNWYEKMKKIARKLEFKGTENLDEKTNNFRKENRKNTEKP